MSNVFSASLAGLNGAVQQFEQAAARIAGFGASSAAPGYGPTPRDSVEVVGSRAPGGDIGALLVDASVARYTFAANAKVMTVANQTFKALLDIKV